MPATMSDTYTDENKALNQKGKLERRNFLSGISWRANGEKNRDCQVREGVRAFFKKRESKRGDGFSDLSGLRSAKASTM